MISVLFLTADPTDASRLRLGEEMREIREKLQRSQHRDTIVAHHRTSTRPEDLTQALLELSPQIVHFSGHGTATGSLCLEDDQGRSSPVSTEALAALFGRFADRVHCVILNACHSQAQATELAKSIPYVVGASQAIGDRAAIAFSVGFYQALGAGKSVPDAFELGCLQIQLRNIPGHLTPQLLKRSDVSQIPPVPLVGSKTQPPETTTAASESPAPARSQGQTSALETAACGIEVQCLSRWYTIIPGYKVECEVRTVEGPQRFAVGIGQNLRIPMKAQVHAELTFRLKWWIFRSNEGLAYTTLTPTPGVFVRMIYRPPARKGSPSDLDIRDQ